LVEIFFGGWVGGVLILLVIAVYVVLVFSISGLIGYTVLWVWFFLWWSNVKSGRWCCSHLQTMSGSCGC